MNNIFYFFYALVISVSFFNNLYVSNKINMAIDLINENLIYDSVTYHSLIEALQYDDESYLFLNVDKLKHMVNQTLNQNIKGVTYKVKYYFYNSFYDLKGYYNSVQIQININYQHINYQRTLRYEPIRRE